LNAYLADYAALIDGLIALHEADRDPTWLTEAVALAKQMVALFWDDAAEQFYDTGSDHERLVVRPRDVTDNALPSGVAMAVDVMLRLAVVTDDREFESKAAKSFRSVKYLMAHHPMAVGHWICALDFHFSRPKEIAVVGRRDRADTRRLIEKVFKRYLPNRVLVSFDPTVAELLESPLTAERQMLGGAATAFVCENYVCKLPTSSPEELALQLAT
jgi:uncharacterized protein YyaL (SSP411 family)